MTAGCGLIGASSVDVELAWSASATIGLSGHRIYHDAPTAGTDFSAVGTVGSGETAFTHQVASPIEILGTHTYMVRSFDGDWESENSNTDAVMITQLLAFICTES